MSSVHVVNFSEADPLLNFYANFVVYWVQIWVLEPQDLWNKHGYLLFEKSEMGDTDTEAVHAHWADTLCCWMIKNSQQISQMTDISVCLYSAYKFKRVLKLDRNGRRPTSDRRRQSSARYTGAAPTRNWCTSPAILNTTRWQTGSKCSCRNTGVMWLRRGAPVTRRAAAFCTD